MQHGDAVTRTEIGLVIRRIGNDIPQKHLRERP